MKSCNSLWIDSGPQLHWKSSESAVGLWHFIQTVENANLSLKHKTIKKSTRRWFSEVNITFDIILQTNKNKSTSRLWPTLHCGFAVIWKPDTLSTSANYCNPWCFPIKITFSLALGLLWLLSRKIHSEEKSAKSEEIRFCVTDRRAQVGVSTRSISP